MELLQRWTKWSFSFNSESFKYKVSITGNTYNVGVGEEGYDANKIGKNETEVAIPLKHLSNFSRALNIPLINCEVKLILTWSKNCVLADMTARNEGNNNDPPAIDRPTGLEFQVKHKTVCSSCYLVKRKWHKLKTGFKRTIKWNKSRSQMTVQLQNNKLNYLIDPTFTNVNRLFVLSFQRIAGENNTAKDHRDSFSHYYVPNVRIKDFNVLIDGKSFFDLPVKNEEEAYEKIIERAIIMTTQLVIYWILLISKKITD